MLGDLRGSIFVGQYSKSQVILRVSVSLFSRLGKKTAKIFACLFQKDGQNSEISLGITAACQSFTENMTLVLLVDLLDFADISDVHSLWRMRSPLRNCKFRVLRCIC